MTLRDVQWTTGNIAGETVPTILERDDTEIVGVYAYLSATTEVVDTGQDDPRRHPWTSPPRLDSRRISTSWRGPGP